MNNMIKLHSESGRGIIRLLQWCSAAPKGPSQVKAHSQTPCLELSEAVRKCYRSLRARNLLKHEMPRQKVFEYFLKEGVNFLPQGQKLNKWIKFCLALFAL